MVVISLLEEFEELDLFVLVSNGGLELFDLLLQLDYFVVVLNLVIPVVQDGYALIEFRMVFVFLVYDLRVG